MGGVERRREGEGGRRRRRRRREGGGRRGRGKRVGREEKEKGTHVESGEVGVMGRKTFA